MKIAATTGRGSGGNEWEREPQLGHGGHGGGHSGGREGSCTGSPPNSPISERGVDTRRTLLPLRPIHLARYHPYVTLLLCKRAVKDGAICQRKEGITY